MKLLDFCMKVGANLRIDFDRKKKQWRVSIPGACYKLAMLKVDSPDGTKTTITYFATNYKPLHVHDPSADHALNVFTASIAGSKLRLHGAVHIVPPTLTAPILVPPPVEFKPGALMSSDDFAASFAKYTSIKPWVPPKIEKIIGNAPPNDSLLDYLKHAEDGVTKTMQIPEGWEQQKEQDEAMLGLGPCPSGEPGESGEPGIPVDPNADAFAYLVGLGEKPTALDKLSKEKKVKFKVNVGGKPKKLEPKYFGGEGTGTGTGGAAKITGGIDKYSEVYIGPHGGPLTELGKVSNLKIEVEDAPKPKKPDDKPFF